MLSAKLPLQLVRYVLAAPYLVLAVTCVGLGRLYRTSYAQGAEEAAPALAPVLAVAKDR